jgi:FdhD protein
MLATPADLEDFALGFALTEGIIDQPEQMLEIELTESNAGITAQIQIVSSCFVRLKDKRRNQTGRTGCGLCGAESLGHVMRTLPRVDRRAAPIEARVIQAALRQLRSHQQLQQLTGATHAAAWFDQQGQFKLIREDVGRHNALDKVIGAGFKSRDSSWHQGVLVMTSRASMEMVQKTLIAGFDTLVAISAPTDLAIGLAAEYGLCLIGFATPEQWVLYSHSERIV